jgi:hypothetical protein
VLKKGPHDHSPGLLDPMIFMNLKRTSVQDSLFLLLTSLYIHICEHDIRKFEFN